MPFRPSSPRKPAPEALLAAAALALFFAAVIGVIARAARAF